MHAINGKKKERASLFLFICVTLFFLENKCTWYLRVVEWFWVGVCGNTKFCTGESLWDHIYGENNDKCLWWWKKKIVGINWSLLSSSLYTYTHCFSLIGDNFVSNCSKVQPFILEVLMSSFERYLSWKITIRRRYLSPGGSEAPN